MQDLNYISKQISKGKNLDINLVKYGTGMSSMYNTLSYIKLSMNYYTVYDMQRDNVCMESEYIAKLDDVHKLIGSLLDGNTDITDKIEQLRNEIIDIMEVVTDYVDKLRIYEYVLNRIEYRFKDCDFDDEYYSTYFTNDLIHYILSDKDNVVIHSKIAEVIEQLPMRLSRSKFYEHLKDAFTLYHGAQKKTIDDYVYSLKTSAGLGKTKQENKLFEQMNDILNTLSNADYSDISESDFKRLSDALYLGIEKMTSCADSFVLLTQVINDLYTISLTNQSSLDNIEETETAKYVIKAVYDAYKTDTLIDEAIIEKFVFFEGKQEKILMSISQSDFAIDMAISTYEEALRQFDLYDTFKKLTCAIKLQSGSDFVLLDENEDDMLVPDDSYADKACEKLINTLDEAFKAMAQPVRRAVMATILSQLPVFFSNTQEIQQYINTSLMQCSDKAEQAAVVEVLRIIMSDN